MSCESMTLQLSCGCRSMLTVTLDRHLTWSRLVGLSLLLRARILLLSFFGDQKPRQRLQDRRQKLSLWLWAFHCLWGYFTSGCVSACDWRQLCSQMIWRQPGGVGNYCQGLQPKVEAFGQVSSHQCCEHLRGLFCWGHPHESSKGWRHEHVVRCFGITLHQAHGSHLGWPLLARILFSQHSNCRSWN